MKSRKHWSWPLGIWFWDKFMQYCRIINHTHPLTQIDLELILATKFSGSFLTQVYRSWEGGVSVGGGGVVSARLNPKILSQLTKFPLLSTLSVSCSLAIIASKAATNSLWSSDPKSSIKVEFNLSLAKTDTSSCSWDITGSGTLSRLLVIPFTRFKYSLKVYYLIIASITYISASCITLGVLLNILLDRSHS